ncbi:MAG: alanyl-tRNA editing protein [Clostridia bacterium]|nr:alanyl-tRNA editing protein [Clostridia bacterium]
MSTEKIYETRGDVYVTTATVTDCRPVEGGFGVTLDRTPFFPGGGGQEPDVGEINSIPVIKLQEVEDNILHILASPLQVGEQTTCTLNEDVRLRRMQNHGGEHIVSGIVNRKYGFNNVGFHMGADDITIDFDGVLTREQLCEVELLANRAVVENRPISILFPSAEQLESLDYRSKKALSGKVRIVEIEGFDRCACCAPHLPYTGMIGMIKILDFIHYKGGIRVHLLCGLDALDDYHRRYAASAEISALLSAPQGDIAAAVGRLHEENGQLRGEMGELRRKLLTLRAESVPETDSNICLFEDTDANGMRHIANLCVGKCGGMCAVFSGDDKNGYKFIIASRTKNLRELIPLMRDALSARGGGKPEMIQGSCEATRDKIEKYFNN